MKTIEINSKALAEFIIAERNHIGSTDFDIYVDIDTGAPDLRHNSYSSEGYAEIIDLYSWYPFEDADIEAIENGEFDVEQFAAWIESDGMGYLSEIDEQYNRDIEDEDEMIDLRWSK